MIRGTWIHSLQAEPPISDAIEDLGVEAVLHRLHASCEAGHIVARLHWDLLLSEDGACIHPCIDDVDGATGDLDACGEHAASTMAATATQAAPTGQTAALAASASCASR